VKLTAPVVYCQDVTRTYGTDGAVAPALQEVNLQLPAGSITALVGPSGSGKSTLLRLLACIDRPDTGRIMIGGVDVARLSRAERVKLRRTRLGFLQQNPSDNLFEYLTVREHLELGAALRGRSRSDPQISALLGRVDMARRAEHYPRQLSGGEQQRAAIAFTAIGQPTLLLADEPTGQLDRATAREVLDVLRVLASTGMAVVAATHDPAVSRLADQVIQLQDGRILEQERSCQ
jgi:putative ABC transport system ATP-binding protein